MTDKKSFDSGYIGPGVICGENGHNAYTIEVGKGRGQCLRCGCSGWVQKPPKMKYSTVTGITAAPGQMIPYDGLPPDFDNELEDEEAIYLSDEEEDEEHDGN